MNGTITNPYSVLNVDPSATPEEIRSQYLSLVREFPPDRDPVKFRTIHAAYQMLSDPMVQAKALTNTKASKPDLSRIIAEGEQKRFRLPRLALLALGDFE